MLTLNATHIRQVRNNTTATLRVEDQYSREPTLTLAIVLPIASFTGTEITGMAHQLGYEREVIRIWFCNKRQALKNTVRMMSKGMV